MMLDHETFLANRKRKHKHNKNNMLLSYIALLILVRTGAAAEQCHEFNTDAGDYW